MHRNHPSPPERQYEPVWKALKKRETVVLTLAHSQYLSTVKRMVSKEKDRDIGFKVYNEVGCWRLQFNFNEQTLQLTIKLIGGLGMLSPRE